MNNNKTKNEKNNNKENNMTGIIKEIADFTKDGVPNYSIDLIDVMDF